jgi:hypothetical protein
MVSGTMNYKLSRTLWVSEDTCLHQVAAQGSLLQHTQEPRTVRCLHKVIIHSTHLGYNKRTVHQTYATYQTQVQ